MEKKRIVILANSIKKGGRCVAGRVFPMGSGASFGDWCRPISTNGEGELTPSQVLVSPGRPIRPLDVVDVPLQGPGQDPAHPEDWIVTTEPWVLIGNASPPPLADLIEQPESLWLEPNMKRDRVSAAFVARSKNHRSIYLIKPETLAIHYGWELDYYAGGHKKRTRVHFVYRGVSYQLNLTDQDASSRYLGPFPRVNEAMKVVKPGSGDNCALCVSLTPALKGIHYKVVATLLELP